MEESNPQASDRILDRQREDGRTMVASWRASGLSMRAYAQQSGISERRLGLWRRRLERQDSEAPSTTTPKPSGFVAVRIQDSSSLEIVVGRTTKGTGHLAERN